MLQKLKKAAEDYLGETVNEAVITVPAYFNDSAASGHQGRRQASPVLRSSASSTSPPRPPSPTASTRREDEVIAVYDFGGGTFDISILEVGDNVVQVISTNGDTHLGGDDIDRQA